jgi:hypothetical protein
VHCPGAEFPVFLVEPGISSILPEKLPFVCENGEPNQWVAGKFPLQPETGIFA